MCDRCPYIGCTCSIRDHPRDMMSVLGNTLPPYTDPLRSGLVGGAAFAPGALGFGLNHNSLLSMPLWRPTATHASTVWCNTVGCPCTLSRTSYAELLDLYSGMPPTHNVWRPWYSKHTGESLYKRSSPPDSRESPSKELPTKILKHDRMKERQELSQTLSYDREHLLKLKSRCTGTQTQITHLEQDHFVNGDHRHRAIALEGYHGHHRMLLPPPPPLPHSSPPDPRGSPPKYTPMETHDAPLNLSLSSSSLPSSSSAFNSQVSRPSVITCVPTGVERGHPYNNMSSSSPPSSLSPSSHRGMSPSRREIITEVCDPAIEEHFRRSLGRNYDYVTPKSSPKSMTQLPPPPPLPSQKISSPPSVAMTTSQPGNPNVSITGSVDEHFAKSLGTNTWSALKAKETGQDMLSESVDDHFAKALGDTWLRIKAEKEPNLTQNGSSRTPPPNSSPRQQRHDTSLLST